MSTAAVPRRPSPASMPARRIVSAADRALIAPGVPAPGADFRAMYEQAILGSRMLDNHRYVGLALAIHADADGQIPRGKQPRLVGLVHDTGLHAGQVVVALNTLCQRGWIQKTDHRARYETADLVLTIPHRVMARLLKPASTATEPSA
ncbi:hypothetical protein ABZS83_32920 [Streptomyces sp. NPDC005426]|uniref:hypothetical protein n=1 Tax=Streptomyces sp. NPDC005426 TaxID=3155344 RepID=UPI0033BC2664